MSITNDLIFLRREPDEALLMNGRANRYLHLPSEGATVQRLIERARQDEPWLAQLCQTSVGRKLEQYAIANVPEQDVTDEPEPAPAERSVTVHVGSWFNGRGAAKALADQFRNDTSIDLLRVRLTGAELWDAWGQITDLLVHLETEAFPMVHDVRVTVRIICDLAGAPNDFAAVAAEHDMEVWALYPMPGGEPDVRAADRQAVMAELDRLHWPVTLVTQVDAGNVGRMTAMFDHHVALPGRQRTHLPAARPLTADGRLRPAHELPDPVTYGRGLVELNRLPRAKDEVLTLVDLRLRVQRSRSLLPGCCGFDTEWTMDQQGLRAGTTTARPGDTVNTQAPALAEGCTNCPMRYICGGRCAASDRAGLAVGWPSHALEYQRRIECQPRQMLIERMLWETTRAHAAAGVVGR